jgi:hypothetical protein|tara:strand:+ start:1705 stop:2274 length:570 start_codon:yes stop_codon:yes gene_type:complete
MTYFKQLHELSTYDPHVEIQKMGLDWGDSKQVCVNSPFPDSHDYQVGTGSLQYDWANSKQVVQFDGTMKWEVPLHETQHCENDFKYLIKEFEGTVLGEMYNELLSRFVLGRVRLMRSEPKTCLSWHKDTSPRIHYPIKTQPGCLMVIGDEVKHLPTDTWWMTDTTYNHTAMNASKETRIHLVAVVLGTL